jgi:manganese/zinc/iron transport system substrate-binding protein
MIADVARRLVAEAGSVEQLYASDIDPHTYEPTTSDLARLRRADAILYNGLHLEGRLGQVLARLKSSKAVYALAEALPHEQLLTGDDGAADPHVWMDVALWSQVVELLAAWLAEHDPPHAAGYRQRAAELRSELQQLHTAVQLWIATIPAPQRVLITAHDAFRYFSRAYAIEVQGIQGISTESEAGLARINSLVDTLVARQIPAVFAESSVDDHNVRALIEGAARRGQNVVMGGRLFSDALGAVGTHEGTYVGMLEHNAVAITRALGGTAPEAGRSGRLRSTAGAGR